MVFQLQLVPPAAPGAGWRHSGCLEANAQAEPQHAPVYAFAAPGFLVFDVVISGHLITP